MPKPEIIKIDNTEYVRKDFLHSAEPVLTGDFNPFEIGAIYLIRTVTMIDLGRVIAANDRWIVLVDAAWIANTGRFADSLRSGKYSEVEPFPDGRVILSADSIIDAVKVNSVQRMQR